MIRENIRVVVQGLLPLASRQRNELGKPPGAPKIQPGGSAPVNFPTVNVVEEQPIYGGCRPSSFLLATGNLEVITHLGQQILPQQSELIVIVGGGSEVKGNGVDLALPQTVVRKTRRHDLVGSEENNDLAEVLPIVVMSPAGPVVFLLGGSGQRWSGGRCRYDNPRL